MIKPSFFVAMPLPSTTGGSGLSRSEAAILAWKKRARAVKPGALDPKIAARVKEILAEKAKKKAPKGKAKAKAGKKIDPAKAKAKADKEKAAAEKKTERERMAAGRASQREQAKVERATNKAERVAAQQAKQQATLKKQKAAARAQKEKAKAKAKEQAAKPAKKEAADPAKKQADNRAKVAKDMADQDVGLSPSGSAALGDFADGKPLDEKTAAQLETMGLTEKGDDGTRRLTADGKAAAQAMNKGDTRAAIDAISRAGDKKKAKPEGKAIDMTDDEAMERLPKLLEQAGLGTSGGAIKAGARHSRTDLQHLQGIHDSAVACGASCGPEDDDSAPPPDDDEEEAEKAIKSIMDDPRWYAQHECNDISQACSALQTLTMLIQSELSEEDEDAADVTQLVDAAGTLVEFISSELDELRGAAKDSARVQGMAPMKAYRPQSSNEYALWTMEQAGIIDQDGEFTDKGRQMYPPTTKGIELVTPDDGEEIAVVSGYSVKALGDAGMVGGYLVKFGGEGDLSQWRDVFTKNTNFGKHTKTDVWVHHRMLPGLGKQQLTNQAELGMDDEGVFVKHLLDLRKSYEAKLYGMVQSGKLGWSSGTAPHLVERKALGDGRHEVLQWTLGLDASYTPMPAGGFVVNAGAMKTAFLAELGLDAIDTDSPEATNETGDRSDGMKAGDERMRRLLLELDLLQLEMETA